MLIAHGVLTPRNCLSNKLLLSFRLVKWRPHTTLMDDELDRRSFLELTRPFRC